MNQREPILNHIDECRECENILSNINEIDDSNKIYIKNYIQNVIEQSESIDKYNGMRLKPSLKHDQYNDEDWEKVKAIVATPDASKVMCVQSSYSYSFYIYNSPKHGLVEITESFWTGSVSTVTSISYEYLVENFRPQEIKMTFNRYLLTITSGYSDTFIIEPDLVINESIQTLVNSKKDEIKSFYENNDSQISDENSDSFDFSIQDGIHNSCDFNENIEKFIESLYLKIGTINEIQYFVTKTKLNMKEYDSNKYFLILFAQIDEHTFVSTHLELSN